MSEAQVGTIHDLLAECIACAGVFDVSTDYEADKADLENATQAVLDHVQTLRDERDRLQLLVDYFRQRCEPFQHGGDHGWKVNGGILPAHIVAALTPAGGQNGQ